MSQISPSEIENVMLRHPAVAEAIVIGVNDPDGGGSVARGFVVLTSGKTATVQELLCFAES